MSDFPRFDYSTDDVHRAGLALATDLTWTDETAPSIRETFRVAYSWRDSHVLPMQRLRVDLRAQMRGQKAKGVTAARLKRMPSIRRKLQRLPLALHRIQDLAGCRAVLESMTEVEAVVQSLRTHSPHKLYRENDYIRQPKQDGYRCHHLMFEFNGSGDEEIYNGRRVELQVRTRLQHSWATAVEAVGLLRREDFKAGAGDLSWRRLFQLMSIEFATLENCREDEPLALRARHSEIVELDRELDATNTLENLRWAMQYTDNYYFDPNSKPRYFLIKYSRSENVVTVEPYYDALSGARSYDSTELAGAEGKNSVNAVLVEADEIENLKAAYPNYFGDVDTFKKVLMSITQGAEGPDYVLPKQPTVPPKPRETPDLSWFKKNRFGRPKGAPR